MNIKQVFCRHDYKWCRKVEMFSALNGETHYLVCKKCGKIKATQFVKFD